MAAADEIRPFFHAPEAELADLPRRINATRRPERQQVTDDSRGVQFGTIQKPARSCATEYDWRRCKRGSTPYPTSLPTLMGDIHFIHARPKQNALPMLATHGWPGCRAASRPMKYTHGIDSTTLGGMHDESK